jgi:hypothetical protein
MTDAMVNESSASTQAQTERLRKYLAEGNTITPIEAWKRLGISRLSARVFDLKEAGTDIQGEFVTVPNKFGEKCRVKRYSMSGVSV